MRRRLNIPGPRTPARALDRFSGEYLGVGGAPGRGLRWTDVRSALDAIQLRLRHSIDARAQRGNSVSSEERGWRSLPNGDKPNGVKRSKSMTRNRHLQTCRTQTRGRMWCRVNGTRANQRCARARRASCNKLPRHAHWNGAYEGEILQQVSTETCKLLRLQRLCGQGQTRRLPTPVGMDRANMDPDTGGPL